VSGKKPLRFFERACASEQKKPSEQRARSSPTPSYDDVRDVARGHAQIKMNLNASKGNNDKIEK